MRTWKQVQEHEKYKSLSPAEKKQVADTFLDSTFRDNPKAKGFSEEEKNALRKTIYSTIPGIEDQSDGVSALSAVTSAADKAVKEYKPIAPGDVSNITGEPGLYKFIKTYTPKFLLSQEAEQGLEQLGKNEAARYRGMTAEQAMQSDEGRRSISSDLMDAFSTSTIGKMVESYRSPEAQKQADNRPAGYQYIPKNETLHSVANVLADTPLYAAGTMLGGPAGTFALPASLRALYEAKLSGKLPQKIETDKDVENLKETLGSIGKEWLAGTVEGYAMHRVGMLAGTVAERLGMFKLLKKVPEKVLATAVRIPTATATLSGTGELLQEAKLREDTPFSLEGMGKTATQVAILEALGLRKGGWHSVKERIEAQKAIKAQNPAERLRTLTAEIRQAKENGTLKEFINQRMKAEQPPAITEARAEVPADPKAKFEQTIKDASEFTRNKQIKDAPDFTGRLRPEPMTDTPVLDRERNPVGLEQTIKTHYPEGYDSKQKQVKDRFKGRPKVREMLDRSLQTWIDDIKYAEDKDPGLMQRLVTDNSLAEKYFDINKMDKVAQKQLGMVSKTGKQYYMDALRADMSDYIKRYSDYDTIEQIRRDKEGAKPYQTVHEPGEGNREAFEAAQKEYIPPTEKGETFTDRSAQLLDKPPAMLPKGEGGSFKDTMASAEKEQISNIEKARIIEEQVETNNRVSAYEASSAVPKYNISEMNDRVYLRNEKFKENIERSRDTIRELIAIPPDKWKSEVKEIKNLDEAFMGKYHNTLGQYFINPSREIERAGGQKFVELIHNPIRAAGNKYAHEVEVDKSRYKTHRKKYKFTNQEIDNAAMFRIAMEEGGRETLAKMKKQIPKALTEREQKVLDFFDAETKDLFDKLNLARAAAGKAPIEGVQNYFTLMRKFSLAEELGMNPIFSDHWMSVKESDMPDSMPTQFMRKRVESTRAVELDAYYVLERYSNSLRRAINYTPVIGKIREIFSSPEFKTDVDKLKKDYPVIECEDGRFRYLTKDKAIDMTQEGYKKESSATYARDRLIGIDGNYSKGNDRFYSILEGTLNTMTGTKTNAQGEFNPRFLDRVFTAVNKGLGPFYLAYNVGSALIQPAAYFLTVGRYGEGCWATGLKQFASSEMREFARTHSQVLNSRMMDVTVEASRRGFHSKLGKARATTVEWGTLPLRYMDVQTATATWLAANRYAEKVKKLTGKKAWQYADEQVIRTQGSADMFDIAPIQRTPAGKAFTIFNTFTINQWNFIIKDLTQHMKESSPHERSMTAARIIVSALVGNTIYELAGWAAPPLIGGTPLPRPISAFSEVINGEPWTQSLLGESPLGGEKKKPDGEVVDAAYQALLESFGILPVVGGIRYGSKSLGGAGATAVQEFVDTATGARGAKPWYYHGIKLTGTPGGQQFWKIMKFIDRQNKMDEKSSGKSSKTGLRGLSGLKGL